MSIEHTAPEPIQNILEPLAEGKFFFACHPGVPCFTECCRDLKLMLTPFDIVKLKNRLGLDSNTFLDEYTETSFDAQRNLSMVHLKMTDTVGRTCPFVSPQGCQVYEDRPAACRTYPLARASRMHQLHGTVQEDYYVLHESHCQGFKEGRFWTVREWTEDQGLELYHELNNLWMQIITHSTLRQGATLSMKQQQMFFLASYDIDKFRKFILGGRFLQLFELSQEEEHAIREDDEALLRLAFKWLNFSLFNASTLTLRQP